jgi:hypothetical protein
MIKFVTIINCFVFTEIKVENILPNNEIYIEWDFTHLF